MNPPNKYKSIEIEHRESHSRGFLILVNWLLLVFLSLLFADEIHYKLMDKTNDSTILTLSDNWKEVSETVGIISLRKNVQGRIQSKYEQTPPIGQTPIAVKYVSTIQKTYRPMPKKTFVPKINEQIESPPVDNTQYLPSNILLVGASSMRASLGRNLRKALQGWNGQSAERMINLHAKLGTGLSRPDVYDWNTVTQDLIGEYKPDMVIAQFVGNDCQTLVTPQGTKSVPFSNSKWKEQYKQRVLDYIAMIQDQGIDVVMIGMPMVDSKRFQKRLKVANQQVKEAAEEKDVLFIDTWEFPLDSKGNLLKELRIKGRTYAFRHQDGIHFTRHGGAYMATKIYNKILQTYHLPEKKDK